jgi:hypothetical protein
MKRLPLDSSQNTCISVGGSMLSTSLTTACAPDRAASMFSSMCAGASTS